jgi:hypothetical protein
VESKSDKDCPEVPHKCSAREAQGSWQFSQPNVVFTFASTSLAHSIPAASILILCDAFDYYSD